jgi:uncharacterized membrane protein (DUF2068 family)
MRDRPLGVVILAALAALSGLISLFDAVFDLFSLHFIHALVAVIWAAIWLFFGLSLWRLRPWARKGTMFLAGLYLAYAIFGLFFSLPFNLLMVVLSAGIIFYMTRPNVRAAFN